MAVALWVASGVALGRTVGTTVAFAIGPPATAGAGVGLVPAGGVNVASSDGTASVADVGGRAANPSAGSRRSRDWAARCGAAWAMTMGMAGSRPTSRIAFTRLTQVCCGEDEGPGCLGDCEPGERRDGESGW